jgi:hypothetical protein
VLSHYQRVIISHSCLTTYNSDIQIAHGAAVAMGHDGMDSVVVVRLGAHLCQVEFGVGHMACFGVAAAESEVAPRMANSTPTGLDGRCDRNRDGMDPKVVCTRHSHH